MYSDAQKNTAVKVIKERETMSDEEFVSKSQVVTGRNDLYPVAEFRPSQATIAFGALLAIINAESFFNLGQKKTEKEVDTPKSLSVRQDNELELSDVDTPNYYEVLGVDENASDKEIKDAYRKLAKQYHPDRLGQDLTAEERKQAEEVMQDVNLAYHVLQRKNRENYDEILKDVPNTTDSTDTISRQILIFHEPPEPQKTPKRGEKPKVPVNFFDQARIMRLQEGPEKQLAIALMLSKSKVSNERLEGIIRLLDKWGQLKGQEPQLENTKSQVSQISEDLGILNKDQEETLGISPTNQITGFALIQDDGRVLYAKPGEVDKSGNEISETMVEYNSVNEIPSFERKSAVSIDIGNNFDLSLSDNNFSFRNNPVFQKFQDKAGGLLKKQTLQQLEKAGIKSLSKKVGVVVAKKVALKTTIRAAMHTLAESLNAIVPGLGLVASALVEAVMWLGGKIVGFLKSKSKELAQAGAVVALAGAALGSTGMVAAGSLPVVTHAINVGPQNAARSAFGSIASGISMLLTGALVAVSQAAVIGGIFFVIMVSLILFIINNSAFVTPQGEGLIGQFQEDTDFPESGIAKCLPGDGSPSGWPVETNLAIQRYYISQGPFTDYGWSHYRREAVDVVKIGGSVTGVDYVISTHEGVVSNAGIDRWGGLFVDIRSSCIDELSGSEVRFRSRHVHFSNLYPIAAGDRVTKGQRLGIMGCTGLCTAPHDHYEFRDYNDGGASYATPPPAIRMEQPHIPQTPVRGCVVGGCNIYIP